MKNIAVDFFSNLFSQPALEQIIFTIPRLFPSLDPIDVENICRPVNLLEVKHAMFNIGSLKSPGYDGFPAAFYHKHWNIYAHEIHLTVQTAFNFGIIPEGLNHTLITLVPKVPGPQLMAQFRPISLCTTVYKVISKIIVARIRPMMKYLISPNQVSYVPGRQISDNVMIVQEILHKFKNSHGKKGYIAWKVDLSKTL